MSSMASSSSSSSASDSSSEDDMSCDDNSTSSSDHSIPTERYVSDVTHNQKFENSFNTNNNSINSNIYDFNSNNESMISDNLLTHSALSHQKSNVSITGPLLFGSGSLISTPELSLTSLKNSKSKPNSSPPKSPRRRSKAKPIENICLDIPITESDRQILLSVGKIKRQKQRPSVERLYNICNKMKDKFTDFGSKEGIQTVLNDMIERKLLQKVSSEKGLVSYREINSAIYVVAITNPKRSRVKPTDSESTPTQNKIIESTEDSKQLMVKMGSNEMTELLTLYKDSTDDTKKESTKTTDENSLKPLKISTKSRSPSKVKKKVIKDNNNHSEPIKRVMETPKTPTTNIFSSASTIDSIIESTVKSSAILSENKELLDIETDRMIEDICSKPSKNRRSSNSRRKKKLAEEKTAAEMMATEKTATEKTATEKTVPENPAPKSIQKPTPHKPNVQKSAQKSAIPKPNSSLLSIEESIQSVVDNPHITPSSAVLVNNISKPSIESPNPKLLSSKPQKSSHKQSHQSQPKCGMCGSAGDGDNELITCSLCGMSGHAISCLNCSPQMLKRIKESSHWECPNCKKCQICGEQDVELIICSVCDRGFHSHCIRLPNTFTGQTFYT